MPRPILEDSAIHPAIRARVAGWQHGIVDEVRAAIASNDVVVVGMGINPWPGKARRALDAIPQSYKYLEYGNYFSLWRPRSALKMWAGWPTFPMVFVRGMLVGGCTDLQKIIDSGELKAMLTGSRAA